MWLGHHDPGFTLSTYVHLLDNGLGDVGFIDEVLAAEIRRCPTVLSLRVCPTNLGATRSEQEGHLVKSIAVLRRVAFIEAEPKGSGISMSECAQPTS